MLPDAGVAADGVGAAPAAAAAPANQQHRFLPKNLTPDQIRRIADSSFPGALYVAGSRAQDARNVALKNSVCQNELDIDRTKSATWRAQSSEMKRVNDAAFAARAAAPVTADAYRDMIVKF